MKKKVISILLAAFMVAGMLAGCSTEDTTSGNSTQGQTEENGDEKLVVYGIYKAGDQTWFIDEGEAAREAVEAAGGEFIYVDAKMSPEEYLKAIDNAIASNASGIVTCIPDQTMSQAVVDKVNEAGIPIVAADDALQNEAGEKIAPWVGIDGYVIGEKNGEFLANYAIENDLVNNPEVGLLLLTMDTVSSCVPRVNGQYDKFTELCPDFDEARIFRADHDGTTDKGNVAAAAVITGNPDIKIWLVTGGNEEGTIGGVRALESAGLDKDAVAVGIGAYMAKDEWNNKGADGTAMKAATYFASESVGGDSIKVLLDLIAGKDVPQETAVSAEMVTPENYKEIMGRFAE